ncbi:hypothetical protein [Paenibacillus sp. USHLN196]|jgi:hypothetical protein|uniref:hypothetical protein n=1 Tax=Paenibacillus sp. USHLN196 TaxID=3081291 RepID=UPI003018CF17
MDGVSIVIGLVLGLIVFVILNKFINITYYGFKAIGATFIGCMLVGMVAFAFVVTYWYWFLVGGAIIGGLVYLGKLNKRQPE